MAYTKIPYETGVGDIERIIPPNPSDIQFEADFRSNTEDFLEAIKVFNAGFEVLVTELGQDPVNPGVDNPSPAHIERNVESIALAGQRVESDLLESLIANNSDSSNDTLSLSVNQQKLDPSGNVIVLSDGRKYENLRFSSLQERFEYVDTKNEKDRIQIKGALEASNRTDLTNNLSWDSNNGMRFSSLQDRFEDSEVRLKEARENLLSYSSKLSNSSTTPFGGIHNRFQEVEERTYDLEVEVDNAHRSLTDDLNARFSDSENFISDSMNGNLSHSQKLTTTASTPFTGLDLRFNEGEVRIYDLELEIDTAHRSGTDTLNLRFSDIDQILSNSIQLQLSKTLIPSTPFTTIEGRFLESETRITDSENLLSNAISQNLSFALTPSSAFSSLEDRFEEIESRAKDIEDNITQATTLNSNAFLTLDNRFESIDSHIKNSFELENGIQTSTYSSSENRFDSAETRITNLETGLATTNSNLGSNYANLTGDSTVDFNVRNLIIHGDLSTSNGEFEINEHNHGGGIYTYLKVKDIDSTHGQLDQAVNKKYIDNINTILSQQISNINGSTVPGFQQSNALFNIPDGKFLSISSGSLTWADPPTFDPNTSPYGWLTHPQVAFHEVQFDGELYLDRTLVAGFTYFIAGDLILPDLMSDGTTPCNSVLTLDSGLLGKEGATLIIQGHVIGDATRIVEDSTNPNLPRVIIQNWADSRADYVIQGTKKTSDLNLSEDIVFAGNLRLEAGSTLEVDTAIQLTFKSLIDNGGTITLTDPNAGVNYFDPQKLIDGAPAALDTLLEISAAITDTDTDVITLLSDMTNAKNDISSLSSDMTNAKNDINSLSSDMTDAKNDINSLSSDMTDAKNDISTLSSNTGSMTYRQDANGDHIYKFNP